MPRKERRADPNRKSQSSYDHSEDHPMSAVNAMARASQKVTRRVVSATMAPLMCVPMAPNKARKTGAATETPAIRNERAISKTMAAGHPMSPA